VLQSLLGRPSRTYTDTPPPAPKDYHSVKQNLIQVATQPNVHIDDEDDAYPARANGKIVQVSTSVSSEGLLTAKLIMSFPCYAAV
jgi:hypothetical protein